MTAASFATQWRHLAPHGPRVTARGLAISALAAGMTAAGTMATLLRRPRVQMLILHHLFPDEQDQFRRLLRMLSRQHALISYGEAVQRAQVGSAQIDRPYLAFTFDDGFKNCLDATRILQEFGAKACFFVCPSIIGEKNPQTIEAFCRRRLELRSPVEFMDWDDLAALQHAGHEIGGHTMTHARLSGLSSAAAADEIGGSFDAIQRRLGAARHFAWTYGRFADCSAQAVKLVYECGYTTCASGVRGCHGPQRPDPSMPICVRRDHIIAAWPISHVRYFLAKSSQRIRPQGGDWPNGWQQVIRPSV